MGRRPGVSVAPPPVAAVDFAGLAAQLGVALARLPLRRPWRGSGAVPHNLAVAVTRETLRSFMGYASSLPVDEYRAVELALDDLCAGVLPPVVRALDVERRPEEVGGVPGCWYRPRRGPHGTVLYFHGGGYIGTSPNMYAVFAALLARHTGCELFVADYRLAPEFPFPADLEDAVTALEALLVAGVPPERLLLAGDSAGGGVVASLLFTMERTHHRPVAGALLFSPEVDLRLDEPSVTANAATDILPWNIPTAAYLHGRDPDAPAVSALDQDVSGWPPTFVASGGAEMFRDPIRRLVEHLRAADVDVVAHEEPGMFHVFPILAPWADATRRTFRALDAFVGPRLDRPDAG